MGSFHPQAAGAGNPWAGVSAAMFRLAARLRIVEARPPSGMLTAQRIDTPPPATSSATDTALWRIPPGLPGTATLIGLSADATGTAIGEVSVQNGAGDDLARHVVPFSGDLGPFPAIAGMLTVSTVRAAGTGSVWVDVLAVRYGPHLADDVESGLAVEAPQETPIADDVPGG